MFKYLLIFLISLLFFVSCQDDCLNCPQLEPEPAVYEGFIQIHYQEKPLESVKYKSSDKIGHFKAGEFEKFKLYFYVDFKTLYFADYALMDIDSSEYINVESMVQLIVCNGIELKTYIEAGNSYYTDTLEIQGSEFLDEKNVEFYVEGYCGVARYLSVYLKVEGIPKN